jgi:hypothetical protein
VFVRAEVSEIVLDDAGKVTHHVTVVCGWWCGVRVLCGMRSVLSHYRSMSAGFCDSFYVSCVSCPSLVQVIRSLTPSERVG